MFRRGSRDFEKYLERRLDALQDELEMHRSYIQGTHQMCQKLMILTPEGKKAAKEFMNFTTAPGGFLPH